MNLEAALALAVAGVIVAVSVVSKKRWAHRGTIRDLPVFDSLLRAVHQAAETGSSVHIALGSGGIIGDNALTSVAALQIVDALADGAVTCKTPVVVSVGDPTLLPLAQDVLRRAHLRHGALQSYDPGQARFIAQSPLAYSAGAGDILSEKTVGANVMAGSFGPEVSLCADAGSRQEIDQFGAVSGPAAGGVLFATTDHVAVGEDLFAAGSILDRRPERQASLVAQDTLRVILMIGIVSVALWRFYAAFFSG
jgi:hypothetical protein